MLATVTASYIKIRVVKLRVALAIQQEFSASITTRLAALGEVIMQILPLAGSRLSVDRRKHSFTPPGWFDDGEPDAWNAAAKATSIMPNQIYLTFKWLLKDLQVITAKPVPLRRFSSETIRNTTRRYTATTTSGAAYRPCNSKNPRDKQNLGSHESPKADESKPSTKALWIIVLFSF